MRIDYWRVDNLTVDRDHQNAPFVLRRRRVEVNSARVIKFEAKRAVGLFD